MAKKANEQIQPKTAKPVKPITELSRQTISVKFFRLTFDKSRTNPSTSRLTRHCFLQMNQKIVKFDGFFNSCCFRHFLAVLKMAVFDKSLPSPMTVFDPALPTQPWYQSFLFSMIMS
jgi:hypothetical protein